MNTPWLDDGDVVLHQGDSLDVLRTLPDCSVQMIASSPPFWGLRDYGVDGQLGLEATPDEWCARLVAVFRECRRVLRDDGVMWLECGDTYAGSADSGGTSKRVNGGTPYVVTGTATSKKGAGVKPKDLVGAPWLLAFALRADGWYLRSEIIWARPNPMPESVKDRPTKAHSTVFLLTKSERYFYDADAIREPAIHAGKIVTLGPKSLSKGQAAGRGIEASGNGTADSVTVADGRNARSVWSIATEPTPFAHFATFPQALVERCILAGTSERGACAACGAPWTREVERDLVATRGNVGGPPDRDGLVRNADLEMTGGVYGRYEVTTTGWAPSCECVYYEHSSTNTPKGEPFPAATRPCVVLDPFMGSGTTALVARRLGRHAVGIELNADYLQIAAKRLQQLSLLGDVS